MKQTLALKLGQSLTMTPQLQQAIRLLQLSALDLQQEIQTTLESNPMLEMAEDNEPSESLDQADPPAEVETDSTTDLLDPEVPDVNEQMDQPMGDELPVDSSWEDTPIHRACRRRTATSIR